jgi:hypothetical protein
MKPDASKYDIIPDNDNTPMTPVMMIDHQIWLPETIQPKGENTYWQKPSCPLPCVSSIIKEISTTNKQSINIRYMHSVPTRWITFAPVPCLLPSTFRSVAICHICHR